LPLCLGHLVIALGGECDRALVKDFGVGDKSQSMYELAAWLDVFWAKADGDYKKVGKT